MSIGYGTYRIPPQETERLVRVAIDSGCQFIDTAQLYGNEAEVWSVVRNYEEKKISVTTKIHRKLIKTSNKDNRSIENSILGTPKLVLLHSPEKNFHIAWEQLKRLQSSIGVSNFTISDIEKLSSKPEVNQIEVTPFNNCKDTVEYCHQHGIRIQAHSPLTKGELLDSMEIGEVAIKHNMTSAQIMIAWSISNNYMPIFSSKSPTHIKEILNTPLIRVNLPNLHIGYRTHPQYAV